MPKPRELRVGSLFEEVENVVQIALAEAGAHWVADADEEGYGTMQSCLNPVTASLPEPEEYVRLAAANGFSAVDHGATFWADWVKKTSLDHVRGFCAAQRCSVGHGGMPVNFREGEDAFRTDMKTFPGVCAVNKALGVRGMATWIAPATTTDVAEFRAMHVTRLREVARVLAAHGLRLGLEFVGPKTSRQSGNPFIYDMPGMLDLCAEINPDVCGLLLDSYHWYTSHATTDDIARLAPEQVVHVHINDAYPGPIDELLDLKRLLPGEGVIDLNAFLEALGRISYDGPVAVETFDDTLRAVGPEEAARRAGKAMAAVIAGFQ
ncbi:MAG: sugar phosphate isomerase/epimerase [Candidatus Hydrogenedentes bacterium]|nr:sugar phosphate isomerase/epimerase [Candidatus Hydrogenedentota bacterium]